MATVGVKGLTDLVSSAVRNKNWEHGSGGENVGV